MNNELEKSIIENTGDGHSRFYVPGHKGDPSIAGEWASRDVTELYFTDDLNHPAGYIEKAQREASELFGSRFTLFTVNGSSAAVMAAVMSCAKDGGAVLLPSDSHLSCYYGAMHAHAAVERLYIADPLRGIEAEELEKYLRGEHPRISCCVITSPTYYGCCADMAGIVGLLHSRGIKVIADESHGTHLMFSGVSSSSAMSSGADYVVHSGHKTVGALTQTAMLHVNDPEADGELTAFFLRSLQSTSPSFPLICSLTDSVHRLKYGSGLFEHTKVWYNEMLDAVSNLRHLEMMDFGERSDPMKITIRCRGDIKTLVSVLRKNKVDEEMTIGDIAVFAMGIGTSQKDISALRAALREADSLLTDTGRPPSDMSLPVTETAMTMSEALCAPSEHVPPDPAEGRSSSGMVCIYPPGAPVLIPGSVITREAIDYIENAPAAVGLQGRSLRVICQGDKDERKTVCDRRT